MTDSAAVAGDLRRLLANSHAPYSGVHVAAAVEDPDGRLHYGVNVENAAYPQGLCAEASAIAAAVTGGVRKIVRVFVATSLPETVWPCGGCRQKILEFAGPGCEIIAFAPDDAPERSTIEALLPFAFHLEAKDVHAEVG